MFITLFHKFDNNFKKIYLMEISELAKKLLKLRQQKQKNNPDPAENFVRNSVHNFSSYQLTPEESKALSFGLDQHIPGMKNQTALYAEFENFYQNLLRNISHISDDDRTSLKTKMRHVCEKYHKVKMPYYHRKTIEKLRKRDDIIILNQDKGRGVVILNKNDYVEKCSSLLNCDQFKQLPSDPTRLYEGRVQRVLRKIKSKLSKEEYKKLYPTGSNAARFYGTAKIHKMKGNNTVEQLPLRPIVSNIGTASYHLAKHLSKLLAPLNQNEYTIRNTKQFLKDLNESNLTSSDYKLVSFDIVSLFTNVPLNKTIDIILRRIYDENEINTVITRSEMRKLLVPCTKQVHFTFNGATYIQTDGVAMGSPLGPVIAGIFVTELERKVLPDIIELVPFWRRYVDDTIALVKVGTTENIFYQF